MELHETVFVVKVRSVEAESQATIDTQARFVAIALHRMIGVDRFELWHEGRRFVFDPQAQDGEHYGHDVAATWEPT